MVFNWFVLFTVLLLLTFAGRTNCWDSEELEIFDLVEDINQNFYTVLGVQQDAKLSEIKRAFRNLSVVLHPDKNNGEDEDNRFRTLVFVYEVLKDPSKRQKYDEVLKNGLPNWKSAMFYYRRVRKMGMLEMSAILFAILTVGQYIISWAAYAEKKYTAESILGSRVKKIQRKNKGGLDLDAILNEIPTPSIFNTLPFQIPRAIWNTPSAIMAVVRQYQALKREQQEILLREQEEEELQKQRDEEYLREKEAKKVGMRKRKEKFAAQEKTDEELEGFAKLQHIKRLESIKAASAKNSPRSGGGGLWTDDDLTELIRLVKKYPGGTPARWETIAESMNRNVTEVTFMAGKMKETGYRVPGQAVTTVSVAENIVQETKKLKAKLAEPIVVPETNWSQEQQRLLEMAMTKYPRTCDGDRWTLVAKCVPNKSREECLERYKHLVHMLKAQKAKEERAMAEAAVAAEAETVQPETTIENKNRNAEDEMEEETAPPKSQTGGGKRRNRRKDKKRNMDFSSDEDDD